MRQVGDAETWPEEGGLVVVLELTLLNSHPASGFPQAKARPIPGEEGHSLCWGPAARGQGRWGPGSPCASVAVGRPSPFLLA